MENNILSKKIWKVSTLETSTINDGLAVEEPLEIQVSFGQPQARTKKSISITMRTPGDDPELALGFLYTEGIIKKPNDVQNVLMPESLLPGMVNNVIQIDLSPDCIPDIDRLERHFYTSSSCGVCGKSSIESLKTVRMPVLKKDYPVFKREFIFELPNILRKHQDVFDQTGGLHASAIFDKDGNLLLLKEDVGRHNALDKIAGSGFNKGLLPFDQYILLVSGRASFELVQKAAMIGVPLMAAVGAPSSLAVELAEETGITLIGFLRDKRFNVYSNPGRIEMGNINHAKP